MRMSRCSLLQEFQINTISGEKTVNKIKAPLPAINVGTLPAVLGKPGDLSHTVSLVPTQGRKWLCGGDPQVCKRQYHKKVSYCYDLTWHLASRAEASECFINFNVCFHLQTTH